MKFQILLAAITLIGTTNTMKITHTKKAWYWFDQTPYGSKCEQDDQCDGLRTCAVTGWCRGVARPPKSADYYYRQDIERCQSDPLSRYYQYRDYYCDGKRVCSKSGWCYGTAR